MTRLRASFSAIMFVAAGFGLIGGAAIAADTEPVIVPENTDGSFYVRGDIGWSFLEWDGGEDDDALTLGGGAGVLWNDVLRSDVRLDWSGNYDTTISDFDSTTLLGNAYIDIPLDLTFTPYVGVGAGWGWIDGDGGDDSGFTYSLMGGATFNITDNLALDAGYRFRDIILDGPDFTDHSISAGALFKF
ncbi:MAG TPA: porin family protein [Aestuariivirgaceae bacterium]